ncbi:hypothetical protein [Aurantiacibacter spongiae]|uniref:Energy transducer TonB n=1 Tax=Aurantiacibacter spongiae TaxID=2488860 RepID=A0A3N5D9K2_9SPHN|nr:hypothetical protein [Aurantiacibacter spongiae]RPF71308.1 hypothetical protein EG799_06560 [Aurantiacibacter spongiae]
MSRWVFAFVPIAVTVVPWPSLAQELGEHDAPVYGPVLPDPPITGDGPLPITGAAADACDPDAVQADGTIVVCAPKDETELYMSPLPKPVKSDRRIIPGLTDPPCWVTNPGPFCIRFGSVPPYPPIIDMTAFPEPLSEEDAARVFAAPGEGGAPSVPRVTGERQPIDLSPED